MSRASRRAFAAVAIAAAAFLAGCGGGPAKPFDQASASPAPDYAKPETWLALPGRNGLERSSPAGLAVVDEAAAPADVFFIHPTTVKGSETWNAAWDAPDAVASLNRAVLMGQTSVFNGCCRIYAPRYRQASLRGLGDTGAVDLAYADVAAAFRDFIARRNEGRNADRPFIIAAHSQGVVHAIRLLQEQVLGTPLQDRLVVAYLIGGYVPDAFPELGLPLCDAADQTGCVLTWNSSKPGSLTARIIIHDKTYWWRGAWKSEDQAPAMCVNPLTWRVQGHGPEAVGPESNPGSMPLPRDPFPAAAATMPPLLPHLTGAGYDVVAAADVAAQPEFIKLHAGGKPAPYAYERGGTAYQTYAPAGQQIVDMTYLGRADTVFAGFKAMSTDGPMFIEARLAKAVDASPVHISVLIDFASAQGNTAKGFFGRMAGSDTAKVDAKLVMSAAGFMTMIPADRIDCSSGFCQGANDASLVARVTNKEALIGNASAVKDIFDAQTKLQKADELGGKLISGLAALAGTSTTMTDIQRNGVNVDPTAYASEARRLARQFTGMAAVMIKP